MPQRKSTAELVLECANPGLLKAKVDRFLRIANMPLPTTEGPNQITIDVAGADEQRVTKLHAAMFRVAFANTIDDIRLYRRF